MSERIPIGQRESERLAFMPARALEQPETIARQVVAMLNAAGGELWVGVRAEEGVASELERIEDAAEARRSLSDSLNDRIEPVLRGDEVEIVPAGPGHGVLRLDVRPVSERRPYAFVAADRGRHYLLRVGDRLRPLSREEILGQGGEPAAADPHLRAERRLQAALREILVVDRPVIWLGTEPEGSGVALDLDRLEERDYLIDPGTTGNRHVGRTFYVAVHAAGLEGRPYLRKTIDGGGRSWLEAAGGGFRLAIGEGGELRAEAPLTGFTLPRDEPNPRLSALRGRRVLDPRALLEYPASIFRLTSALVRDRALWSETTDGHVACLALVGVDGWFLRPDPEHPFLTFPVDPGRLRLPPPEAVWRPKTPSAPFVIAGPVRFPASDVRDLPDYCAYRLLRGVFREFGYSEDEILVFDRQTRRFAFS